MCGIAGILDLKGRAVGRPVLERICARLAHRGPDDEGIHADRDVALGQRRLSIIDLSSGRQPMGNEDGTIWVTFNGEIYNFLELRADLEARGHRFATRSDTEAIVHAYEQYGTGCLERFRGMFAFAVWDGRRRLLFLARDRVGKKPLFYAQADGQFVFASELQALVEHPGVRREVDPAAVDRYLTYGYIPAPGTIYRGVSKLSPGHFLVVEAPEGGSGVAAPREEPYWQLAYTPKLDLDEGEAAEGLLEVLTEAVRLRLIADVPLGALLSGGVDSSVVVALMSRLSDRPVQTFSIGFEEKSFNELPYARLVARRYGTDHHELIVRAQGLDVLPTLVRHYGEPFADPSAVPSYHVARLTRQHVTVALNGDGGDECFAGYERYLGSGLAERYRRIPRPVRVGMIEPLAALIPGTLPRRNRFSQAKRFLQVAAQPAARRYLRWVTYFTPEQKQGLYTPEFRDHLGGHEGGAWLLHQFADVRREGCDHLDALLATDVRSYLPYDLLVKMDIATMASSLEARSPFLDHKVMEFAARLPGRYKLHGTTLKYLLKKVARKLLPAENLDRRKMGFGIPVGNWMRGELRPLLDDVLLSPRALARGYFRPEAVQQLVKENAKGPHDQSPQLWALLWLELWHREFLEC
jgi:asparagine synthase (glutamine-hydrolysing)